MHYVTELNKARWQWQSLDIALLHTERITQGAIGNKAFKLDSVKTCKKVMSFGGSWSNHLHALAYQCHQNGRDCVGVVRQSDSSDNVLMQSARRYGMQIHEVSRADYRLRDDPAYCARLAESLGCDGWLPEGGATADAVVGCERIGEIISQCGFNPTVIALPVGTGTTLAGIVRSTDATVRVIGLPVVRDDKVAENISRWTAGHADSRWTLTDPLAPAYGKVNIDLLRFIVDFHEQYGVVLDPMYTGKALAFCLQPEFTAAMPASRLLFVHTGGLMGCVGFEALFNDLPCQGEVQAYMRELKMLNRQHLELKL